MQGASCSTKAVMNGTLVKRRLGHVQELVKRTAAHLVEAAKDPNGAAARQIEVSPRFRTQQDVTCGCLPCWLLCMHVLLEHCRTSDSMGYALKVLLRQCTSRGKCVRHALQRDSERVNLYVACQETA